MEISPVAYLSGIKSAQRSMDVTANNVANVNTDGFKKDIAQFIEGKNGGVTVTIRKSTEPGPIKQIQGGQQIEASNVDLAEEAVNMITYQRMTEANLAVLRTDSAIHKSLIDIFA